MTSRLKKKLNDLGVDTSSARVNENFCLVRLRFQANTTILMNSNLLLDWYAFASSRENERCRGIPTCLEARCARTVQVLHYV